MPLSDDQKAMLRLLAQREQGYDDLAALLGLSVDEVRAKVKDALAQLEEEGAEVPAIPEPPAPEPSPAPPEPPVAAEPPQPEIPAEPVAPEPPTPEPAPTPEPPVAESPPLSRPRTLPRPPSAPPPRVRSPHCPRAVAPERRSRPLSSSWWH